MATKKFITPKLRDHVNKVPPNKFTSVLIIDIETTGQSYPPVSEIIELAACDAYSDAEAFHVYVNPEVEELSNFTTGFTTLSKVDGVMLKKSVPVPSEPVESAVENFVKFLEEKPKPIMLVAHKANFDVKFLIYHIRKSGLLQRFLDCVVGFADTLEAARKFFPLEKNKGLENHSLIALYCHIIEAPAEGHHEAANDVAALKMILPKVMPTKQDMSDFSFDMAEFEKFSGHCEDAIVMLPLLNIYGVTSKTLYNMAQCGLTMDALIKKVLEDREGFLQWLKERAPLLKPGAISKVFEFVRDYKPNDGE